MGVNIEFEAGEAVTAVTLLGRDRRHLAVTRNITRGYRG